MRIEILSGETGLRRLVRRLLLAIPGVEVVDRVERFASARPSPSRRHLLLHVDDRHVVVDIRDLRWIGAEGNYVAYYAGTERYLCRGTLCSAESILAEGFVRVSRSAIVNLAWIRTLETYTPQGDCTVVLKDGSRITATRHYRSALDALFVQAH